MGSPRPGTEGRGRDEARRYWQTKACGSGHSTASPGTAEHYEEADRFRYRSEPVAAFAEFERWAGVRVLEIGTGMGGDLARFVRAGASATGVDLSPMAIEATAGRLRLEGLPARMVQGDALSLPFRDSTFGLVWSWGVLHHTGDVERGMAEVRRVLAPDGLARLMLYHRPSWVAVAAWTRWSLAAGRPWRGMRRAVAEHVESPGTQALTVAEVRALMDGFVDVSVEVVGTYWDRRFVPGLGRLAGSKLGWFALVRGRKP
jgi:SAM-dependent methyltransferase